jgi:hypothetical protein
MYWSIVTALAEIGAAALPGFIAGAQHGDASIRQFSVQRIEQFGERAVQQAVEQLASALGSDNIYTSVRAANLGKEIPNAADLSSKSVAVVNEVGRAEGSLILANLH